MKHFWFLYGLLVLAMIGAGLLAGVLVGQI